MDLRESLASSGALNRRTGVRTSDYFAFAGGLNLTDPPMMVGPGQLLGCKNFEPGVRGGYDRTEGYERFDGRTSPTDGAYTVIEHNEGVTFLPAEGATITQAGSGATGVVAYVTANGSAGTVVVVNVTVAAFTVGGGTCTSGAYNATPLAVYQNSAETDAQNEEYIYNKTDYLRSLIGSVGGGACAGSVLGVWIYENNIYAFRNNSTNTAGTMWKATSTGWQSVALGFKIRFNNGSIEIAEGASILGLTSGATCIARRIVVTSGMWGTGDAAGYIVTESITGTFTAAEDLESGDIFAAFVSSAAQTLAPGGRYRFRNHNFEGFDGNYRMYGVNSVNRAFQYDGTYFVLIETGSDDDTPRHIAVHNDHLLLAFAGGSLQNSGFQQPLKWNVISGANEQTTNDEIVAMNEEINQTVTIATRQQTYVFYGDVRENFQFKLQSPETGMLENTIARIGKTIYLDDRGFTTLAATTKFGNFQANAISDKIQPLLNRQLTTTNPMGAVISRKKNLYRCFFSDGFGLVIGSRPGGELTGWTSLQYPDIGFTYCSGEVTGELIQDLYPFAERTFMGGLDGYVYELDKGRSFDGEDIEAFCRLSYHHTRSPEVFKRYRRLQVDIEVSGPTTILGTVDYNYGLRGGQAGQTLEYNGGGGFWDIAAWNEFQWDGSAFDQIVLKLEGSGFNIGFFFYTKANDETAYALYGASLQSSFRRINRGTQEG